MVFTNYMRYLWFFILFTILLPPYSMAEQFAWVDYKNTFATNIEVCPNHYAKISVDIPPEAMKAKNKYFTLVIHTTTSLSYNYQIYAENTLYFNRHRYPFPSILTVGSDTVEIKIKTKHFKNGENIIKPRMLWKAERAIPTCAYKITKLYFKELSSPSTELALSSKPSGVDKLKGKSIFLSETALIKSKNADINSDAIAVVIGNQNYEHKDIPPPGNE